MTQLPGTDSVKAVFDGVAVELSNGVWRFEKRGDEFWVVMAAYDDRGLPMPNKPRARRKVEMITGSHHMQLFWLSTGYTRKMELLPVAWLIDKRKWIPRDSAFLVPPGAPPSTEPGRWNEVCIRCHVTHGRPGIMNQAEMDTRVAEFGISCEACHGPAEEHVAINGGPVGRYAKHLNAAGDVTVAQPMRMDAPRNSLVCGQCHSVNAEKSERFMTEFFAHGAAYRPGGDSLLSRDVVQPTRLEEMETPLARNHGYLSSSFWSDGMIRVSGREYNGLIESPCHTDADSAKAMSCFSCHQMHRPEDDKRALDEWRDDQLKPGMRTNEACLQCHSEYRANLAGHTHHAADSSGSLCYNCHMPHTTYGLLKAIRSHHVSSPSVQESLETGRPNACNQCHMDKSLEWTAKRLNERHGVTEPALDIDSREVAASLLWGIKGDAGQRALMAWTAGWEEAKEASGDEWQVPMLAQMLVDPYSAVRRIAARSLRTYPGFDDLDYDPDWDIERRRAVGFAVVNRWSEQLRDRDVEPDPLTLMIGPGQFDRKRFGKLAAQRDNRPMYLNE